MKNFVKVLGITAIGSMIAGAVYGAWRRVEEAREFDPFSEGIPSADELNARRDRRSSMGDRSMPSSDELNAWRRRHGGMSGMGMPSAEELKARIGKSFFADPALRSMREVHHMVGDKAFHEATGVGFEKRKSAEGAYCPYGRVSGCELLSCAVLAKDGDTCPSAGSVVCPMHGVSEAVFDGSKGVPSSKEAADDFGFCPFGEKGCLKPSDFDHEVGTCPCCTADTCLRGGHVWLNRPTDETAEPCEGCPNGKACSCEESCGCGDSAESAETSEALDDCGTPGEEPSEGGAAVNFVAASEATEEDRQAEG